MPKSFFKKYRCAFIPRGRGQKFREELLPELAVAVKGNTPQKYDAFVDKINKSISRIVPGGVPSQKARNNWRTETIGKILGLYYLSDNGVVKFSERGELLIKTSDQPQFFKDLVGKIQVPSGLSKPAKARKYFEDGIRFMPAAYILNCLQITSRQGTSFLTKKEIGLFVLSNLKVLTGRINPASIVKYIIKRRKLGRPVIFNGSNETQHTNELLNLMAFANLIRMDGEEVRINSKERGDISRIIGAARKGIIFKVSETDFATPESRRGFETRWMRYFAARAEGNSRSFKTDLSKIVDMGMPAYLPKDIPTAKFSTADTGLAGEIEVYTREYNRVRKTSPDEISRVRCLAKITGLGFDVQSVADDNYIYIEVKTTIRASEPKGLSHNISLTSNEWKAARQHSDNFYIYAVYLTEKGAYLYRLKNPNKSRRGVGGFKYDRRMEMYRLSSSPEAWERVV